MRPISLTLPSIHRASFLLGVDIALVGILPGRGVVVGILLGGIVSFGNFVAASSCSASRLCSASSWSTSSRGLLMWMSAPMFHRRSHHSVATRCSKERVADILTGVPNENMQKLILMAIMVLLQSGKKDYLPKGDDEIASYLDSCIDRGYHISI